MNNFEETIISLLLLFVNVPSIKLLSIIHDKYDYIVIKISN